MSRYHNIALVGIKKFVFGRLRTDGFERQLPI